VGTAKAVKANGERACKISTLSQLIHEKQIHWNEIALIKVDTDGFDADCLMSLGNDLTSISPLLFWEHYFETDEQQRDILRFFTYLEEKRYEYFCLFDNTGVLICTGGIQILRDHHQYLINIFKGLTNINGDQGGCRLPSNAAYYMDVLACKTDKKGFVKNVIVKYSALIEAFPAVTQPHSDSPTPAD
jgi:hypothetical protein